MASIEVQATCAVEHMRRGEIATVELDERIEALITDGKLIVTEAPPEAEG